ncbi:MAG: MBL fold metallo-hydrolase, partial [Sneathiella sp.]|nr:MBL fold metallo-hydrolase [Sneathiella sp.]
MFEFSQSNRDKKKAGPPSPFHHVGQRFRNLPNPDIKRPRTRSYLSFVLRMLRYSREKVTIPEGHVIGQKKAAQYLHTHLEKDTDCLTWLGQACFLLKINGKIILTDPYLSSHASPTTFAGPKRIVEAGIHL